MLCSGLTTVANYVKYSTFKDHKWEGKSYSTKECKNSIGQAIWSIIKENSSDKLIMYSWGLWNICQLSLFYFSDTRCLWEFVIVVVWVLLFCFAGEELKKKTSKQKFTFLPLSKCLPLVLKPSWEVCFHFTHLFFLICLYCLQKIFHYVHFLNISQEFGQIHF